MISRTTLKISLALAGMVLFGAGIRLNEDGLRWAGVAVVAVAWLLRFWKSPPAQG